MRLGAGLHARVATSTVIQVNQKKVLRFEQSLVQVIVEPQTRRNHAALRRCHSGFGHGLELGPNPGKFFQHQIEFGARDFHYVDGIECGASRDAFDRAEQPDLAEIIAAAQIRPHHFAAGHRL